MKRLIIFMMSVMLFFAVNSVSAHAGETDTLRESIYNDINTYRIQNGLQPLLYGNYEVASDVRAQEAERIWSHTRPDGSEYWTADERIYGENLAKPSFTTVDRVVPAWINSPIHNSLLLAPDYASCCVGVYETSTGYCISCEFGY